MKKIFQWMCAAILVCGVMVITSCSSDSDDSWYSEPAIAMIVKNGDIDYWKQVEKAFKASCEEKGIEAYYYATSAESAYEEQQAAVAELRLMDNKNLKGIIFTPSYGPNGESAEADVAALAKERGIPVVILDSPVREGSPLASCPYFGTDNTAAGKQMASLVDASEVAVFAMKNSPGIERAKAFKELKPNAVVYEVGDKAVQEVQSVINQYDDFVFTNGNDLVDVLSMLKIKNKNVYTFDVYGEFLDELIEGSTFFKGIMAQNTFSMARMAVEAVLTETKEGEIVPTKFITQYNLDDLNVLPFLAFYDKKVPVIENLAELLEGKWMSAKLVNDPMLTEDKDVITFLSDTKAAVSYSKSTYNDEIPHHKWSDRRLYDMKILGNKVILQGSIDEDIRLVYELVIKSINDKEIVCRYKHGVYNNGEEEDYFENDVTLVKLDQDFRNAVSGTWEGNFGTSEAPELWRWEFKEDGTYVFSMKSGGEWQPVSDEFSEYFVDGKLLCVRWKNNGSGTQEEREWWEIVSIDDNKMTWYLHAIDDNGNPYSKSVVLTKVVEE